MEAASKAYLLPLRWVVGQPEPFKLPLLTFSSALAVETGLAVALH